MDTRVMTLHMTPCVITHLRCDGSHAWPWEYMYIAMYQPVLLAPPSIQCPAYPSTWRCISNLAGDCGRLDFLKYALEHAMSSVPCKFGLFRSAFACTLLKAKNAPLCMGRWTAPGSACSSPYLHVRKGAFLAFKSVQAKSDLNRQNLYGTLDIACSSAYFKNSNLPPSPAEL